MTDVLKQKIKENIIKAKLVIEFPKHV